MCDSRCIVWCNRTAADMGHVGAGHPPPLVPVPSLSVAPSSLTVGCPLWQQALCRLQKPILAPAPPIAAQRRRVKPRPRRGCWARGEHARMCGPLGYQKNEEFAPPRSSGGKFRLFRCLRNQSCLRWRDGRTNRRRRCYRSVLRCNAVIPPSR